MQSHFNILVIIKIITERKLRSDEIFKIQQIVRLTVLVCEGISAIQVNKG